ncbi:baseplate assembly protein [Saccharibacter sp. EH60]|uniref:phage baseplate assembly protein n=1 Tax=Saccharibacter sp. EH60 TaxID=2689390 RepID=UPI00135E6334|nr:phage baseplate assembly protein [Saccharibacter sp. EH60]MXV65915.1 baseplate assembly protein [Saccharibacter sp. EH60]
MTAPPPFLRRSTTKNSVKNSVISLVQNTLGAMGSPILVRVEAVHGEGVSLTGKVDVVPLVEIQDATGRPRQRELIYGVPYLRIQGGTSAVIVDPKPGDIGFVVIAGRDQTNVVTTRQPPPPASTRHYSLNDCVYVGGFLNEAPNQYVQFTDEGVRIVTPGKVEIDAASIAANCDITTTGDITAGGVSLKNHTHGGVQPGSGNSGKPT